MEDKDINLLIKTVLKHDHLISVMSKYVSDVVKLINKMTPRCATQGCEHPATVRHKLREGNDNAWCDRCAASIVASANRALLSEDSREFEDFLTKTLKENADVSMWEDVDDAESMRRLHSYLDVLNDLTKTH